MNPIASTLYCLGYTLWMSQQATQAARCSAPSDRAPVQLTALAWARHLCDRLRVHVTCSGLQLVDWSQPHILVANHQSLFDIPVLLQATGHAFGFLTKRELFRIPAFGQAMLGLGCVSIDRTNLQGAERSLQLAAERVRKGASIAVFPEGTRSVDGRLLAFKKGPFYLIQEARVQAVPVAIDGTRHVLPKNSMLLHPAHVRVRLGTPMRCADGSADARNELRENMRRAMLALLHEVER